MTPRQRLAAIAAVAFLLLPRRSERDAVPPSPFKVPPTPRPRPSKPAPRRFAACAHGNAQDVATQRGPLFEPKRSGEGQHVATVTHAGMALDEPGRFSKYRVRWTRSGVRKV